MTFEEETKCNGYFGFGSGVNLGKENTGYCVTCPLNEECYATHKDRMRQLFTDLCAEYDEKEKEMNPYSLVIWWTQKHGRPDPYILGMTHNMEDGAIVKAGGTPKNRGIGTLPYPFNVAN